MQYLYDNKQLIAGFVSGFLTIQVSKLISKVYNLVVKREKSRDQYMREQFAEMSQYLTKTIEDFNVTIDDRFNKFNVTMNNKLKCKDLVAHTPSGTYQTLSTNVDYKDEDYKNMPIL